MEIETFIGRYPRLFHMAEKGTWPSIKKRGLLSASAVLDLLKISGKARALLEREHRPEKVVVGSKEQIVLRDQKPMAPGRLAKGLQDGLKPSDWYELINGKVFMWATEERLYGLLGARHYRVLEHDVLTIDTASLVSAHAKAMWLCAMNSGNTFPFPHPRGKNTFLQIAQYAVRRYGQPRKEVVEVLVDYSIPDISKHVIEVRQMRGDTILRTLPL